MQAMNQWSNHSNVPLCFVTRSPKFSSCFKGSNGSYFSVTWNLRFIQSSICCFSSPTVIPSECNPVLWPPPRQSYLQWSIKINQFTSFSQLSILLLSWPSKWLGSIDVRRIKYWSLLRLERVKERLRAGKESIPKLSHAKRWN